jgi:SagB-type dehydrogenase family enzyme
MPKTRRALCERFHEETKYLPGAMERFRIGPVWRDTSSPFKAYHSERVIDLVAYLPFERHPFHDGPMPPALAPEGTPGLADISRLLFFTNGVTAILPFPDGTRHYLRAAPSAGALYPTEIYVALREIPGVADGIYSYLVRDHALVPVWEGDPWEALERHTFGHAAVAASRVVLMLSAVWARSEWRYLERAYRRMLLDTGHVLGNAVALAPGTGLSAFPIGGFRDGPLNERLLLTPSDEALLCLVALPRLEAVDLDHLGGAGALPSTVSDVSEDTAPDPEADLSRQLHRASCIAGEAPPAPGVPDPAALERLHADAAETVPLDHGWIEWERGIEVASLARRSARRLLRAPMPLENLGTLLSFAYQPTLPHGAAGTLPQAFDPTLLMTYIVVHDVPPLAPGVYYYVPTRHELRLVRPGEFRDESRRVCLDQDLGGDAAALVVHAADLGAAVARYGERAYRYLHLDAGHIGQRLNLGAVGLGLGASGIGGFYDNDATALVGAPPTHGVAYITCLGVPPTGTT